MKGMYAVVNWYNYRKEQIAGFNEYFEDYEEARRYAYKCAISEIKQNCDEELYNRILNKYEPTSVWDTELLKDISKEEYVITEKEITDNNGPCDGPYDSLIGYGNSSDGYSTIFYSVVKSFDGVENSWCKMDEDENEGSEEWVPRYD